MEMSFAVSGTGTSGVCPMCFSFAIPLSEHLAYVTELAGGTPVRLTGDGGSSRVFYISSKSADDVSVKVTCYDRMTYTEADFPCDESDFIDPVTGEEIPMSTSTVLSRICTECGFPNYYLNDDSLPAAVPDIPKSMLMGRTCHDVLSSLSEAFCGYWCCSGMLSDLMFVPFGADMTEVIPIVISSEYHEKIKHSSRVLFSDVFLTNNVDEYGTDPGGTDTIRINTSLASPELYDALYARVRVLYSGMSCGNAYIDVLPSMPMRVDLAGEEIPQYINYCNAKISSRGILASLGRNKIDEGAWTYKNRTRRELEKRYREGDTWKNIQLTKKGGLSIVYQNLNN